METMELHRGRLVDHIQLVVADLAASRRFYQAVLDVLGIPLGGNNIEAVFHGQAQRSAPSAKISF